MASARGASPTKSGGGDIGDGGDDFGLDFSELCAGGPSETASVVVTGAKRLRETLRQKGFGSPVKRRSTGAASEQDSRPEERPRPRQEEDPLERRPHRRRRPRKRRRGL